MRKADQVWEDIFNDYPIIETIEKNGCFEITADQIRKYHEPRLVTKFDFSQALPNVMKENDICILPNTTGTYILGKFNIFKNFPNESTEVHPVSFPKWIESIDPLSINSEAIAITAATITPMFQDFFDDDKLIGTVSGRMGSGQFDFIIGNNSISVNSSQIEIDGALESPERFVLLEGKNILHDDFIIRQLYYPYRTFLSKVNKPIHSLFITYSNNVYRLMEYRFNNYMRYDSCEFIREKKYCIDLDIITLEDIKSVHDNIGKYYHNPDCNLGEENYGAPFPQCDSFSKIINIIENLEKRGEMTKSDITELFGFTPRQADYYYNGCRYLGMVQLQNGKISLTDRGKCLINMAYKERQLTIVGYIFEHTLFYDLFLHYLQLGEIDKAFVKRMMHYYKVCAEGLIDRRSSTALWWFNWILGLINQK